MQHMAKNEQPAAVAQSRIICNATHLKGRVVVMMIVAHGAVCRSMLPNASGSVLSKEPVAPLHDSSAMSRTTTTKERACTTGWSLV